MKAVDIKQQITMRHKPENIGLPGALHILISEKTGKTILGIQKSWAKFTMAVKSQWGLNNMALLMTFYLHITRHI